MATCLVSTRIWVDPQWRALSKDAQWLYLLLATGVERRAVEPDYWTTFANIDRAAVDSAFQQLLIEGAVDVGAGRIVLNWNHLVRPRNLNRRRYLARWYREWVLDRGGNRCAFCGSTSDLSVDHIHPVARGGGDEPENLQVLCRPCNSRKGAR